jgi:glucosamine--fructose-6-phosphate aminotransferase (isomerizing)
MQQELFSEPQVIRDVIAGNTEVIGKIVQEVKKRGITNISTVARGTSDNATICFKYICEILTGMPVAECHPSVITIYKSRVNIRDNMTVAISQSGASIDTLAVLDTAKKAGALTVAVTNSPDSPLARMAHYHIYLSAGEEKSVAATKTFIAELVALYMLAIGLSGKDNYLETLSTLPASLEKLFAMNDKFIDLAHLLKNKNNFIVLTRGTMQGVGKELALKLAECTYSYGHSYSVTDFMHGPLALVEEGVNVIMLAPDSECTENYLDIAARLNLLGANITALTDIKDLLNIADNSIKMPHSDFMTSTVLYGSAVHMLVMNMAIAKGLHPDSPRNLKKVTITK